MDHLWTPWRMAYIRGEKTPDTGCVFCNAQTIGDDSAFIVARSEYVYAILNRYPYNNGHLMIVPYEHVASQETMADAALLDMMQTTNRAMATLRQLYQPTAFNLGANLGAAAGAGITEHYHFHVVPRWAGDANFISVVGETRVIANTLENTYRELKTVWQTLFSEKSS